MQGKDKSSRIMWSKWASEMMVTRIVSKVVRSSKTKHKKPTTTTTTMDRDNETWEQIPKFLSCGNSCREREAMGTKKRGHREPLNPNLSQTEHELKLLHCYVWNPQLTDSENLKTSVSTIQESFKRSLKMASNYNYIQGEVLQSSSELSFWSIQLVHDAKKFTKLAFLL